MRRCALNSPDLSDRDRQEIATMTEFLRALEGGPLTNNPALRAWVEADPKERLAWLGVTREQARAWGLQV